MEQEGIIKYQCDWEQKQLLEYSAELKPLISWRDLAFQKGYIGVGVQGIGFGNISVRVGGQFLISASATGHLKKSSKRDFSLVKQWNFSENWLSCVGEKKASSESLSHAVVYEILPEVQMVLHIHHPELWMKYKNILPATPSGIAYGTPEMALSISQLIKQKQNKKSGVFLMKAHEDGLIAYAQTYEAMFKLYEDL
ncbi:MAG: rRNA adenine methyltransferase [Bacteroidetes bacterium 4572_77]|nr:MAG: rRNA adenine methyltransferase [Bacteroidetes bacterium 4572_77]